MKCIKNPMGRMSLHPLSDEFSLLNGFWGEAGSVVAAGGAIYLPLVVR